MATESTGDYRERATADLRTAMNDTEELLRATSSQAGEQIAAIRARAQESLRVAKAKLDQMQADMMERGRETARVTEGYVRDYPWTALGVAAGVGLAIGLLIARR